VLVEYLRPIVKRMRVVRMAAHLMTRLGKQLPLPASMKLAVNKRDADKWQKFSYTGESVKLDLGDAFLSEGRSSLVRIPKLRFLYDYYTQNEFHCGKTQTYALQNLDRVSDEIFGALNAISPRLSRETCSIVNMVCIDGFTSHPHWDNQWNFCAQGFQLWLLLGSDDPTVGNIVIADEPYSRKYIEPIGFEFEDLNDLDSDAVRVKHNASGELLEVGSAKQIKLKYLPLQPGEGLLFDRKVMHATDVRGRSKRLALTARIAFKDNWFDARNLRYEHHNLTGSNLEKCRQAIRDGRVHFRLTKDVYVGHDNFETSDSWMAGLVNGLVPADEKVASVP
jgi:hypothetical protein